MRTYRPPTWALPAPGRAPGAGKASHLHPRKAPSGPEAAHHPTRAKRLIFTPGRRPAAPRPHTTQRGQSVSSSPPEGAQRPRGRTPPNAGKASHLHPRKAPSGPEAAHHPTRAKRLIFTPGRRPAAPRPHTTQRGQSVSSSPPEGAQRPRGRTPPNAGKASHLHPRKAPSGPEAAHHPTRAKRLIFTPGRRPAAPRPHTTQRGQSVSSSPPEGAQRPRGRTPPNAGKASHLHPRKAPSGPEAAHHPTRAKRLIFTPGRRPAAPRPHTTQRGQSVSSSPPEGAQRPRGRTPPNAGKASHLHPRKAPSGPEAAHHPTRAKRLIFTPGRRPAAPRPHTTQRGQSVSSSPPEGAQRPRGRTPPNAGKASHLHPRKAPSGPEAAHHPTRAKRLIFTPGRRPAAPRPHTTQRGQSVSSSPPEGAQRPRGRTPPNAGKASHLHPRKAPSGPEAAHHPERAKRLIFTPGRRPAAPRPHTTQRGQSVSSSPPEGAQRPQGRTPPNAGKASHHHLQGMSATRRSYTAQRVKRHPSCPAGLPATEPDAAGEGHRHGGGGQHRADHYDV